MIQVTAVGFEPTPFRNGALSHRLRPLGQTVLFEGGLACGASSCSNASLVAERSVSTWLTLGIVRLYIGLEVAIRRQARQLPMGDAQGGERDVKASWKASSAQGCNFGLQGGCCEWAYDCLA